MYRNVLGAALVLAVLVSCASSSTSLPEVSISQMTKFSELLVGVESGLPMDYRLSIDNPATHPVTLISVEVETVGETGGYAMKRVRHSFSKEIAAKSSDSVDFRAWVHPLTRDQKGDVSSPVLLRGTARFETPSGIVRRNFANRGQ